MRSVISFILVTMSLMLIGCGGTKSLQATDTGEIPDWFTNVPKDPNSLYGAKTATSQDLQLAIDKAATDARAEIASGNKNRRSAKTVPRRNWYQH